MGDRVYRKSMKQYTKRLAEIEQARVHLQCKKIRLIERSNDAEAIRREGEAINQLTKELQDKYFKSKILTKDAYLHSMEEYRKKEADLEKARQLAEHPSASQDIRIFNISIHNPFAGKAGEHPPRQDSAPLQSSAPPSSLLQPSPQQKIDAEEKQGSTSGKEHNEEHNEEHDAEKTR